MERKDYSKLYGVYKLFFWYATRYNCLEIDQLSDAEKDMYSNYIINMFQNMSVDELVYIYSRYMAFNERFNELVKKYKENSESEFSSMYDNAYFKRMKNNFSELTEDERKNYTKSSFYIVQEIARELNFSRNMPNREIDHIERMVNGMAEELKNAIDNKINLISVEEINEMNAKKDDLVRETMMIAGRLGKDFDTYPSYNKSNTQLKIYEEYLKKVENKKTNPNEEQLKAVVSNNETERVLVSDNEYVENGTHYHMPNFDEETHIQLK